MSWFAEQLRLVLVAWQFFTRVPLGKSAERWMAWSPERLRASARFFPLIGGVIGAFGALVFAASSALWPPTIAALFTIAATALVTGAFHEDGFADYFDSFGGTSRAKALAIMKDSRIGTFGAAALILLIALKAAALSQLMWPLAAAAIVTAHTLGRAGACVLMRTLAYARDDEQAKAKPLAEKMSNTELLTAVCIGIAPLLIALQTSLVSLAFAAMLLVAVFAFVGLFRLHLLRRIGGFTGDTLGAAEQIIELIVLLAFATKLSLH